MEVTKLNLLLKALEGETQASINQQMQLFHARVLPNLSHNIQCGNSLIGPDFYDNQFDLFPGQMKKINAFDWHRAFPEVFKVGASSAGALAEAGFDCVIGNPPYVRQELLGDQKEYFKTHYKVYHGMADLYSYFFERGLHILAKGGLFGIIVANKWMRARYGEPLREWLKKKPIRQIIDFGDLPVFQQATTYPCIFIAGGEAESTFWSTEVKTLDFVSLAEYHDEHKKPISRESLNPSGWQLVGDAETNLLAKLRENSIPLGEYVKGRIFYGIKTGYNEAFVIDQATKERLITEDPRSAEVIKPFLAGRDIKRYQQPVSDKYLIFTRRGIHIDDYPTVRNYLLQFKEKLIPRPLDWKGGEWKGRKPGPYKWYEIQDTVAYWQEFEKPKIIISAINKRGNYTLDLQSIFSNDKTTIIGVEDYFLLGLLNSKACDFFLKSAASTKRGGYFEYKPMYLAPLPIPRTNQTLKDHHDQISHLAISLISLNEQILTANLESQRTQLQRAIDHAGRRIDELVYELYGLTEEEVAIVEGR